MPKQKGRNGEPSQLVAAIPTHVNTQVEVDEFRCPKTGHVVPLEKVPSGTIITGKYTLFNDSGKVLGTGRIEDLAEYTVDAGTADAQADSEEA